MKKKLLKKLIKEQVASLLTEKFASKKITDIYRKITGGRYASDKKFWGASSKAYGIEWDKVTDDMVSGPTPRMTRKGLEFILASQDMDVRGTGRYDYPRSIKKGQLVSAAYNGKAIYFGKSGVTTGAASAGTYPQYVGLNVMGFKNSDQIIKKLKGKVEVYQIDIDKARGAGDKQKSRSAARAGATALMDFRDIARQNRARYEQALTDRLAKSSPVDQAWKMLEATQKMVNDALKRDLDMLKKGKAKDSWRSASSIIQNAYERMTRSITNILSSENAAIKGAEKDKANKLKSGDKSSWSEEKYYLDRIVEEARKIQKEFKEMKAAISRINKDREYVSIVREFKVFGTLKKGAPKNSPMKAERDPALDESKKQLKEEYIEIMKDLNKGLALVKDSWLDWKRGPMTEPSDIKPAQKELMSYMAAWMKKNIK
tara:strand:- start:1533 stop:2819 length:1287 start_codon:yes stop_codon:yes gene_type:complete